MTSDSRDLVGKPITVNEQIRGLKGQSKATMKGTVRWRLNDDTGQTHTVALNNVYVCKNLPFRLLSPQHWAQERRRTDSSLSTQCITDHEQVYLLWNDVNKDQFLKTIPLDPATNIGIF